jgi:hypothetical protein
MVVADVFMVRLGSLVKEWFVSFFLEEDDDREKSSDGVFFEIRFFVSSGFFSYTVS